jgi:hypothetical protein
MIRNSIIEIGVAVVHYNSKRVIFKNRWNVRMRHDTTWEQKCLDEFWLNPKRPEYERLKNRYEEVQRGEGMDRKTS